MMKKLNFKMLYSDQKKKKKKKCNMHEYVKITATY